MASSKLETCAQGDPENVFLGFLFPGQHRRVERIQIQEGQQLANSPKKTVSHISNLIMIGCGFLVHDYCHCYYVLL